MPAQIFGNQATAVQLYIAFNGVAPSNPIYQNYLSVLATSSPQALADQIGDSFASVSDATLATTVLTNLGVTAATTNATAYAALSAAVAQIFAAYPGQRGIVVLNMINILTTLESNATYGVAAAAFNNTTLGAYVYASNPTSTSPGDLGLIISQGTTLTLTAGVDLRTGTAGNDTFDGSVNAQGTPTLTSIDNLNGGDGTDLLIGGLAAGTIAPTLSNIENAEFVAAGSTFDLVNTTGLQTALVRNSTGAMTFNNIASTTTPVFTVKDQAGDVTFNFANGSLAGANSFTVNLSGAQSDGNGGAAVALAQQAGTDTSGLETVNVVSGGSSSNFLASLTSTNAAAASMISTLNVSGAQGLTIATGLNASVRTVGASGMTGAVGLTGTFGATNTVTVTGSGGNDSLTFTANAAVNSSINAGAGNDVVTFNTVDGQFDANDTVAGGDGTADRLSLRALDAEAIGSTLTNTTGFEQLSLNNTTVGAALVATRFGTIDTVRLDGGTVGAYGVTMQAGTVTLGVGDTAAGALAGALTVTDTGTAATDVLNLTNRHTGGAVNVFAGNAITSAGYETVNLSTGSTATLAQTVGLVTINNDSLSGANTLNISGINSVTLAAGVASNSSGLLTINASGLTSTATLTMGAAPAFTVATGTVSITGSANADTLLGTLATASTIAGGAGNDTITGGTAADSIAGDAGNDTITTAGGNDTVTGGDGNDAITSTVAGTVNIDGGAGNDTVTLGGTLTAGDTVAGGDGTDTLSLSAAATAATAAGVSGFETLTFTAAVTQGLEQFTSNTGFTRVNNSSAGLVTINNAGANVATLGATVTAGSTAFSRLVDTSSNSLAITPGAGGIVVAALTVNDEETITVSTTSGTAASNVTFTTMSANDLTSLTVSGLGNFSIGAAITGAANLATVNASGNTGTVVVDASTSTANMTMTGSFSGANTLTGGTGTDTITGGTAADSLTGGNGGDLINGGAGNDLLLGGLGADVINGEIGDDTITGGVGNDTLSGGEGLDDFVFEAASNGVDTITGFVSGTDDLNVTAVGSVLGGAIAGTTTVTAAGAATGASIFATDNQVFYLSFNGAAANLTTGDANTLTTADLTAGTLTNVAAYLGAYFNLASAANANDVVVVVNWTAGGSTTSYVYEAVNNAAADALTAAELTLIGVVDRGTTVLNAVNTDVI